MVNRYRNILPRADQSKQGEIVRQNTFLRRNFYPLPTPERTVASDVAPPVW